MGDVYIIRPMTEELGLQMLFNSLQQRQEPNPNLLISKYQLTFSHWLHKAQWKTGLYSSFDLCTQPN